MKTISIAAALFTFSTYAFAGECRARLEPMLDAEKVENSRSVFDLCAAEAGQGDAEALYFVSFFYFGFDAFARDESKGLAAARSSAEKGYAEAQYWMGWQHEIGNHLPRNEASALQWYEKSAASGFWMALDRLARAHRNGELGLSVDTAKAEYYSKQRQKANKR
jgi:TPR repeat protein